MIYYQRKKIEHCFNGQGNFNINKTLTYNLIDSKKTIPWIFIVIRLLKFIIIYLRKKKGGLLKVEHSKIFKIFLINLFYN